ncbi:bestrophin-like domain [Nocardia callitridis]|uniref:DUF4239 domain-containing protein n=1 Tax=Nocardia callitridis TaxID=648753 RepID=A0ABP9JSI0_9NOCA
MIAQVPLLVLFAAVAVSALVLTNRLRPKAARGSEEEHDDGIALDIINTFFAAVVALVVVIGWQNYDNARAHTVDESKALTEVYSAADQLPDGQRDQLQGLVREYTARVVDDDWPAMAEKRRLSDATQQTFDELRTAAFALPDIADDDARANVLTGVDGVEKARYDRALDADLSMPGFLYAALWLGTALLLLGMVLVGSGKPVTRRRMFVTAVLGVVVGWVILAIYNLDRPFAGGSVVPADAFELALTQFQHRG